MDSDDEYERRRRRDKFQHERSDYRRDRDDRRRDAWTDRRDNRDKYRQDWNRRPYQSYARGRPDYRDNLSPPNKRPRRDWDSGYSSYDRYSSQSSSYSGGGHSNWNQPGADHSSQSDTSKLLSFKQFLATQEDTIDDQEAVKKYNEYKLEFKKAQLSDFFLAHKEEEWFKVKYHPEEVSRSERKRLARCRKRLQVFLEFLNKGLLSKASADAIAAPELMKLMDTVVIKLEGGTEFDMEVLEEIPDSEEKSDKEEGEVRKKDPAQASNSGPKPDENKEEMEEGETQDNEDGALPVTPKEPKRPPEPKDDYEDSKATASRPPEPPEPLQPKPEKKKKKSRKEREYSYSSDESSSSGSESEASETEPGPPGEDHENGKSSKPSKAAEAPKEGEGTDEKQSKPQEPPEEPKPRALHKTFSLFFRNVTPNITKQEIIGLCKRYKGFLRVALAEPQEDRNWSRHGWMTFDRSVNIKEICWNLSSIRLKECELSPVVNRDLSHRIRAVSGITAHKTIIRIDLKRAARLIQLLDEESRVWDKSAVQKPPPTPPPEQSKDEEKKDEKKEGEEQSKTEDKGDPTKEEEEEILDPPDLDRNPVLENITDYLVEETSAEEQLLLGTDLEETEEGQEEINELQFERDQIGAKVLDRLLFYLRFVHSVDYYSCSKFHIEDDMPNRCGLMHVRGANPPTRMTQKDIDNWKANFEKKIMPLLTKDHKLSDEELAKMGKKDQIAEVEKFVTANTQELAKDKWLCPLSGKKFKGPEFVRKHIFNKHSDKVDSVRNEVEFYNNYLRDPERPQPPDPTPAVQNQPQSTNQPGHQQGNSSVTTPHQSHYPQQYQQNQQSQSGGGYQGGARGGPYNQSPQSQGGGYGGGYQGGQRGNYDPYGYTPPAYSRGNQHRR